MATADNRTREITPKTDYRDLTRKQKAIVDAIARNPNAGDTEIADAASESLENDSVSRSYVPSVRDKQSHLIEQRRETLDNQRFGGEERTTGDPFAGEIDTAPKWQTFAERPHADSSDDADETDDSQDTPEPKAREGSHAPSEQTLDIEVSRVDVLALLEGHVPESLQAALIDELFRRAFE